MNRDVKKCSNMYFQIHDKPKLHSEKSIKPKGIKDGWTPEVQQKNKVLVSMVGIQCLLLFDLDVIDC